MMKLQTDRWFRVQPFWAPGAALRVYQKYLVTPLALSTSSAWAADPDRSLASLEQLHKYPGMAISTA